MKGHFHPIGIVLISSSILLATAAAQTPASKPVDSVMIQASTRYDDPSFFKRLVLGTNYREEWETPVTLPVFRLATKGFTIKELGGGFQTKSLRFEDKEGQNWVLRTIDKEVEKALPPALRNTLARRVTQDMISAAHPYAPVTIPPMAKALNVIVPEPVIYFVPDDPLFGEYRSIFANTVCLLERRDPTPDKTDTKNSDDMFEKILKDNDHLILQQNLLKARLLDMLVGDWDRHADQWRWGQNKGKEVDYFYGIPRDRDQAYFYSNGLLLKVARLLTARHFVSYKNNLKHLKNLNFKSWKFDKLFLNTLDRHQWDSTIRWVQTQLNDELLHKTMLQLPKEIYPISGQLLEKKLRGRRDDLLEKGMKYYRFLSKVVTVNGTEEEELFSISNKGQDLVVQVFAFNNNKPGHKIYERVLTRKDTYRVILNGFGGNDQFVVEEGTASRIKLQIAGGKGNDVYNIKGQVHNIIQDEKWEANQFVTTSRSKKRM